MGQRLLLMWSGIKTWIVGCFEEPQEGLLQFLSGIIVLGLGIWFGKKLWRLWKQRNKQAYVRRERILTKNELRFFKALQQAAEELEADVFPMLRISEILRVKKQSSRKKYYKLFSQISRKHIDFTLCRKENNEILCCVELEEAHPLHPQHEKRDRFIRDVFRKTGLTLVEIPSVTEDYDAENIKNQLRQAMEDQAASQVRRQAEAAELQKLEKKKKSPKHKAMVSGSHAENLRERKEQAKS